MITHHTLPARLVLDGTPADAWLSITATSRETAEIASATYRGRDVTAEARAQLSAADVIRADVERCARSWYGLPRTVQS